MDISFNIEGHNDLDEKLIAAAEKNGLYYLKGHRAMGGMRHLFITQCRLTS